MRKLTLTCLTLLGSGMLTALPVGNPAEASFLCDSVFCPPCAGFRPTFRIWNDFNYRGGFYGDYIFNRHLRVHDDDNEPFRSQLDHSTISTNAGYLVVNLWNSFDVFGTLGASSISLEGNSTAFGPLSSPLLAGERVVIETNTDFSWSIGLRGTLWQCGNTYLGMEGQFFRTEPHVKQISLGDFSTVNPSSSSTRLRAEYNDWQVGVGVARRMAKYFIPYIAIKWSGSELHFRHNVEAIFVTDLSSITLNDFKSRKHWGYAFGCSLIGCEKAAVTAEGRFGDEKALYINAQLRF